MVKLVVSPSNIKTKKYKAVFTYDDKKTKTTHFGAKGMEDYTTHKDKDRRKRYRDRHKKDLETKDYTRAGYLSYYILWGKNTNFKEAVKDYKKKFNLS
jgi:hypothetical protein|tara:strand:- start:311 stop:604 length:294 start_codon:yes stop_codon:yes gene_type:complete